MEDIDIPSIARDRTPDGPVPPNVEAHDGPTPDTVTTAPCPHCGEPHTHGHTDEPKSHRTAHCEDRTIPGRGLGYFLLRPLRGLLNQAVRWWKDRPEDTARNLGFDGDGPGLLPVQEELHRRAQEREQDGEADRE